jgi:glutathione S-transferase
MLTLYHREKAGRPARVRWALEEAGADYEYVVMTNEEAAASPHLSRHPLGKVPVLETDDGCLFESAALCLQIADTYPDAALIPPPGTYERGQVYQWSLFAMSELEPAVIQMYRARRDGDEAAATTAAERLEAVLGVLDRGLDGRTYLVGESFGIADVVVGGVLSTAQRLDVLDAAPRSRRYLERLDERPAKQRAYAA